MLTLQKLREEEILAATTARLYALVPCRLLVVIADYYYYYFVYF
jgi:hypothetical protein